MASLDELMSLPGALAAFEFSDKGELVASKVAEGSSLNDTVLDLLCHVCVANTAIATMQARGWENMTGSSGFYPVEGFSMIGLDWTTVTHGQLGVVLKNDGADYQAAYDALGK
jgi:roadblock/LC7 domain-containing protein